jgi:hypothetical protein
LALGLKPHYLSDVLIESLLHVVARYAHRLNFKTIDPWVKWQQPTNVCPTGNEVIKAGVG